MGVTLAQGLDRYAGLTIKQKENHPSGTIYPEFYNWKGMSLTEDLKRYAKEKGIDVVGTTSAKPVRCLPGNVVGYSAPQKVGATEWNYDPCSQSRIDDGLYDPTRILANARSIVMAALYMYGIDTIIPSTPGVPRGKIGPWTRDYNKASKYGGEVIGEFLKERGFQAVVTNNLPYKTLALRTGVVSIGKNGFVFSKAYGSYLRWTCIVTDAELEGQDVPIDENCAIKNCGWCTICLDACPTGALKGTRDFEKHLCLHLWLQGAGIQGEV